MRPKRIIALEPPEAPTICVATDTQADSRPSAGYLQIDPLDGSRRGGYTVLQPEWLAAVGFDKEAIRSGKNPIGQCEAAAVLLTLWNERKKLARRNVIWFIDNTSDLHAFVRGSSSNQHIDRAVQAFHILACRLHCVVWFDYVPSAANWSDGVSRHGFNDPFARQHSFKLRWTPLNPEWWPCSLNELWTKFGQTAME